MLARLALLVALVRPPKPTETYRRPRPAITRAQLQGDIES